MPRHTFAVAGACPVFGLFPWQAAVASNAGSPHISAHPNRAMVNQTIRLFGTGFRARNSVRLMECSASSWVVPQQVCTTGNARNVRDDGNGAFITGFTLKLCGQQRQPSSAPVTARTCYIGEPAPSGVDTERLIGAVKVTVFYP